MAQVLDGRSEPEVRTGRLLPRDRVGRRISLPGPVAVGLASACLLVVALGLLTALAMRPFTVIDENAHTSYALEAASGHLPTMRSPTQPLIPGMGRQGTYVANHPPLYYAVVGMPMRVGVAGDRPTTGFLAGRVVTLGFMVAAVLLIGLLARSALPDHPAAAVAAPAVVAATPFFPSTGAQIANDSAALATTVAVLLLGVALIRRPTGRRLLGLVLVSAAAALVRSVGLQAAGLASAAAFVAFARRGPMDHRQVTRRVARGLVAGLAVALPVVLASGWYYLRNRRLYGDLLGAKYAVTLFPGPHLGLNATLFSETFWAGQLRQLLTRPGYVTGAVRLLGHVVIVVIALGLLSLLVRTVPRLRGQRPATTSILVAGLLAADFLLGWTDEFRYVAMGGFGYIRYALPAFPVLALLVGLALLALPLGRRGAFVVAVVGVLSAISIVVLSKGISFHHRGWEPYGILERYRVGLLENGLPVPTLLLGALLALVVLALAGLTFSLVRCTRPAQLSDEGVAA